MSIINITKAEYVGNLSVKLSFNDETEKIINVGDFLKRNPHPQTDKYLIETNFEKFKIEDGNIVWGENADLIFPVHELPQGNIK
jgi:hypothetical protein